MSPKRVHTERAAGFASSFFSLSYVYSPLCLASCLGQKNDEQDVDTHLKGRISHYFIDVTYTLLVAYELFIYYIIII